MRHHSPSTRRGGAAVVAVRSGPAAGPGPMTLVERSTGAGSAGAAAGVCAQPAKSAARSRARADLAAAGMESCGRRRIPPIYLSVALSKARAGAARRAMEPMEQEADGDDAE